MSAPVAMCRMPFLGPEPAELFVDGEVAIEAAEIVDDLVETAADDVMLEGVHRGDDDLVAAAVREREAVAGEAGVGDDGDVGRGVVAEVQGVRPVHVSEVGKRMSRTCTS